MVNFADNTFTCRTFICKCFYFVQSLFLLKISEYFVTWVVNSVCVQNTEAECVLTTYFLLIVVEFLFFLCSLSNSLLYCHREDAQAPKRVSWAKSNTGSDIVSKNGTMSSIATTPRPQDPHQPNYHYPYSPVSGSDTGSVINAYQLRPGEANMLQGLPGYNIGGTPLRKHKRPASTNGGPPQVLRSPAVAIPNRTERAQPQVPPPLTVSPQMSSSTLTRMGAVAVMVPAQSQAGSLV